MKEWTEGRRKSFITSVIRAGFRRYPQKYECLKNAYKETKTNKKSGRLAKHYLCAGCKEMYIQADVQVDHITPVVSPKGFITWDNFINNLFCDVSNLQILCKQCHAVKTKEERNARKRV